MHNDMKTLSYKDTSKATNCPSYVLPNKITASSTKHYIAPKAVLDLLKRRDSEGILTIMAFRAEYSS